jgi:hypothetical protein
MYCNRYVLHHIFNSLRLQPYCLRDVPDRFLWYASATTKKRMKAGRRVGNKIVIDF